MLIMKMVEEPNGHHHNPPPCGGWWAGERLLSFGVDWKSRHWLIERRSEEWEDQHRHHDQQRHHDQHGENRGKHGCHVFLPLVLCFTSIGKEFNCTLWNITLGIVKSCKDLFRLKYYQDCNLKYLINECFVICPLFQRSQWLYVTRRRQNGRPYHRWLTSLF